MTFLNAQGRTGKDHLAVLDIDNPGADGLFGLRDLELSGYTGPAGTKHIDLHGFDVEIKDADTLRFYMVNHRPPMNGSLMLDATKLGANSTIEIFDVARGKETTEAKHIRTVSDEAIYTPNKVIATGDGSFVVTNDKPMKSQHASYPHFQQNANMLTLHSWLGKLLLNILHHASPHTYNPLASFSNLLPSAASSSPSSVAVTSPTARPRDPAAPQRPSRTCASPTPTAWSAAPTA